MSFNKFDYIVFVIIALCVSVFTLLKIDEPKNNIVMFENEIVNSSSTSVQFHSYSEDNHNISVRVYADQQWAEEMPLDATATLTNDIIEAFAIEIEVFDDYKALHETAKQLKKNNLPYYVRVIQVSPQVFGLYHGPFVNMANAQIAKKQIDAKNIVSSKLTIVPYRSAR